MAVRDHDEVSTTLLELSSLIQTSIADYVAQRQRPSHEQEPEGTLPSRPMFDAQRTLLAAAGKLTELVSSPPDRLLEVSSQYFEARALHIAADKRIPDVLGQHDKHGLDVKTLGEHTGIESRKLCECFLYGVL